MLYLGCAILSVVNHPLWAALLMLDTINMKKQLYDIVIASLWKPKWDILFALIFLLILFYIIAIFGFAFFQPDFPVGSCNSLLYAWISVLDKSQKYDGGITGMLSDVYTLGNKTVHVNYRRVGFDFIVNLIVTLFMW